MTNSQAQQYGAISRVPSGPTVSLPLTTDESFDDHGEPVDWMVHPPFGSPTHRRRLPSAVKRLPMTLLLLAASFLLALAACREPPADNRTEGTRRMARRLIEVAEGVEPARPIRSQQDRRQNRPSIPGLEPLSPIQAGGMVSQSQLEIIRKGCEMRLRHAIRASAVLYAATTASTHVEGGKSLLHGQGRLRGHQDLFRH